MQSKIILNLYTKNFCKKEWIPQTRGIYFYFERENSGRPGSLMSGFGPEVRRRRKKSLLLSSCRARS